MSISGGTDAYSLAIALLGGGGVGAVITKIYDHWMKRSQERIDMARIRIDTISKAASYYNRLAVLGEFGHILRMPNENHDYELMFYYLCNTSYLRRKVIQILEKFSWMIWKESERYYLTEKKWRVCTFPLIALFKIICVCRHYYRQN